MVILFPVLIGLVWAVLQGAWVYHGGDVAQWAATGAVQVARAQGGTDTEAQREATERLRAADGVLRDARVTIDRTPTTVTVTVTGRVDSMIPGVNDWGVTKTASGAIERFTTDGT